MFENDTTRFVLKIISIEVYIFYIIIHILEKNSNKSDVCRFY